MEQKRTVAIDCDSVLFPINELVILPMLTARLGRTVYKREITSWTYGDIPDGKEIAMEGFTRPNLYDGYDLSVTPDAEDALAVLRSQYRVIAVSTPFRKHASSKWAYLQRIGFKDEDIVLCGDKDLVRFDVLVDDRPDTARAIGPLKVVVFDQPWNRDTDLSIPHFQRAFGWEDVPRKVARLFP